MKRMRERVRAAALVVVAGTLVAVSPARAQEKAQTQAPAQNQQESPAQNKDAPAQDNAPAQRTGEQNHAHLPPPYKVVDGFFVDPVTMNGFRAWRAAACDRCHGAYQQGLVGPSLLVSLKTLGKQEFITTVTNGRLDKGMPSFKTSKTVMENIDGLYAYLKGRAEGDILQYRVREMKEK